jgi:ABC-type polysaccharide/polyol phosphate export permease
VTAEELRGPEERGTPIAGAPQNEHRTIAGESTTLARELRDISRSAHLLRNLVHRDITIRYKRSVLGFFWTMLHPLLLALILMMVFSSVFRFAVPRYELYVLAALCRGTSSRRRPSARWRRWRGTDRLKRVRVPKSIFTLSTVLAGLVNLGSRTSLVLIMLVRAHAIRPAFAFLPVSLLILAVFTYGVSLLLSALAVYFVDVREMFTVALTALMYFTPVIYPIEVVPERFRQIFEPIRCCISSRSSARPYTTARCPRRTR